MADELLSAVEPRRAQAPGRATYANKPTARHSDTDTAPSIGSQRADTAINSQHRYPNACPLLTGTLLALAGCGVLNDKLRCVLQVQRSN